MLFRKKQESMSGQQDFCTKKRLLTQRQEEFCFGQSVETVEKTEPEFGCGTEPEVVEGDFSLSIVGTGFRLTFDKVTGKLVACKIGKKSLCMMASIR